MCLYTFDDPAINNGTIVGNWVPNEICPFDGLKTDNDLVTSLNSEHSYWQLGVHLAKDSKNASKRVQLSSISSVSARDFFTMAAVRNDSANTSGVTFEMVIRRRTKTNQSITLFSIANEYDNCVDSGFRLDVNEHQVLVFIYFLPMLEEGGEEGVEACHEQRLFSVDNSAACQLPSVLEPVEQTPPVHITVTLDPSERGLWKTDFYMSYTDTDTMERVDCTVHDEQHPPNSQLLNKLVEGRYRLYLGNNPRSVNFPQQRKHLAPAREFQLVGNTTNLNGTERLRELLKQKLMNIRGPRLPTAMRIFGDNSLSLHILGITFPPLNEDTPIAYLRSKFSEFKEKYGDQIVDYLVNLDQQTGRDPVVTHGQHNLSESSSESDKLSRATLFQDADSSTFDVFHFAIYRCVVSEDQVNSISWQHLLRTRQFQTWRQTVRIPEDSLVLLNLTILHGVFNDMRLELRSLPEFGRLLLFPNKTVVTLNNKDIFRKLPLEYQRSIFFQHAPDQNNENLPLPNPVAFSRKLKPYATFRFGVGDSFAGWPVNNTTEAEINIFVYSMNDAPRPRQSELKIEVEVDAPLTLNLEGDDVDGAPTASSTDSSDLLSDFTFTNETDRYLNLQSLKIVQMPQFGKLFHCNSSSGLARSQDLESSKPTRIYQNSTNIANATHSTNIMYIYHGWGQRNLATNTSASVVVDQFWYKLSDGDPDVFSDVAVVKFVLASKVDKSVNPNVLAAVRLEEDSLHLLHIGALDPLAAVLKVKTQFKVTALPQYGALFQYNAHENDEIAANLSIEFIGERITIPNTSVTDIWGRVFFVPKPDYFNMNSQGRAFPVDYFEYQVLSATSPINGSLGVYDKSPAAHFSNVLEIRRVELEVVNIPDSLTVLPPIIFTATLLNGDAVPTPVAFEDPDSITFEDMYQVNLEAEDRTSELKLGVAITDDDVMRGCPLERPCTLLRSSNGRLDVTLNSTPAHELQFYITTQLYDPSHIQVTGTKTALNMALSALTFRDLSSFSLKTFHKTKFILWVKRDNRNDTGTLQAEITFTINFPARTRNNPNSSNDFISILNSQLGRYISTSLVLLAGWIVLSNGSCVSVGFCCCCCSKARRKRRLKLEKQQRCFQAQVAQSDHEYSLLLLSLADILLEPTLLMNRCLLESCASQKHSQADILTQPFILRSLLPLLESERQGTRFVFQLMAVEYSEGLTTMKNAEPFSHRQAFLSQHSAASKALIGFCRIVGAKWLSALFVQGDATNNLYMSDATSELERLVDKLVVYVEDLPTEIVILSRACAKLFGKDDNDQNQEMKFDAVHLVFFNHFLGPVLLFPVEKTQSTVACRYKYEAALESISQSSTITAAYDPNECKADVDSELMGMCLMNIHSLLDSYFPEFKRRMLGNQTSTNIEQVEKTITCVSHLLKALGWPLASIQELVEYARPELTNDPLLQNGFSFHEWYNRSQTQRRHHTNSTCRPANKIPRPLLAENVDDCILEHDHKSPQEVDWLS
ncbi:hypothetical protein PHMEG_00018644 [Phytophthora megakarya]|uniref:Ras-GAP domain-containing protein n=1 Tax=Phytophthora megakarya TaxID=4795 RepID=A0A225VW43_9STRA|nr:hypothetical protein PHMEG_00018644 [Phytophthora megakarya]